MTISTIFYSHGRKEIITWLNVSKSIFTLITNVNSFFLLNVKKSYRGEQK